MILNCNSCGKKFVVPDSAISTSGRLVQCGSCGNKWRQFPVNEINKTEPISNIKKISSEPEKVQPNRQKAKKVKKTSVRKPREIDLYSPEYLAKKHGIKIKEQPTLKNKLNKNETKVNFGFYNSFLIFIIITISVLRILYFTQDIIVEKLPISEIYITYLFETIRNINAIIQNFFFVKY